MKESAMGRKYNRSSEADIILEILARIPVSNRYVSADEIVDRSRKRALKSV